MFGYATDETEDLMPLTTVLAHKLNQKLSENRRNGVMPYLYPDTKTQVTVEYEMNEGACVPIYVHTVVISTQTSDDVSLAQIQKDLKEKIVKVYTALFTWLVNLSQNGMKRLFLATQYIRYLV